MALESATFIEDLVPANPLGTDGKAQGDNHIRLVKDVLQNQFTSLGAAAVTATAAELNNTATDLVPTGVIVMWSGTVAAVPSGWSICDGTGGTPNLVSRFIVGSATDSGATFDIGDTGGSADISVSVTSDGTAITESQMPSHDHRHIVLNDEHYQGGIGGAPGNGSKPSYAGYTSGSVGSDGDSANWSEYTTDIAGSDATHTHGVTVTDTDGNLPPYFALAFIIKL